MEIGALWAGVVIAAIVGITGIVFGVLGHRLAKKADERSERALRHAEEANSIARDANELSQEANSITRRVAEQATEIWHVDWAVKWDKNAAILRLTNLGRDTALQPSVVVTAEQLHYAQGFDDTVGGEELIIPLPQVLDRRTKHEVNAAEQFRRNANAGLIMIPGSFKNPGRVTVLWVTPSGAAGRFEQEISLV